jgi:primosomal protein N'
LSKKHNSIAYHKCKECVASHAMWAAYEPGCHNMADGLTKFLPRYKFLTFVRRVLYQGKCNSIDENDKSESRIFWYAVSVLIISYLFW